MTAFILSSAIAFALYQLLLFMEWPPAREEFYFYQGKIVLTEAAARVAPKFIRSAIVVAILLFVLTIHHFASPIDALVKYEVNIVFGFVFGPLFAIWINSIVVHSANKDLTRGQILAAIGLVLLFFIGALGDETARLIKRYAGNLSSLKVAGTELSFTAKERGDRLTSTSIAGSKGIATVGESTGAAGTFVTGGSAGLPNLAGLDGIVQRDLDYLSKVFAPAVPVGDLERARDFATASIAAPLSCLFTWFQQTGDLHSLDKYLTAYADAFRQLEALNTQMNSPVGRPSSPDERKIQEARLRQISSNFVRNGLTMALDITLSTTQVDVLNQCETWFKVYCPPDDKPAPGDQPIRRLALPQCLQDGLNQFAGPTDTPKTGKVADRIDSLTTGIAQFVTPQAPAHARGLEMLPYFAIARASLMAQLDQHEAAVAILDDWLHRRTREPDPLLQVRDDWFALRVRSTLITYVEEWLEDEDTSAATVVQTEHLENLRATRDSFRSRLLKADFFKKLDTPCQTKCEPAFRRPTECSSDESNEQLKLWGKLYTSYITMEYTYIHRALQHPDYRSKFAETVNDEARRLVNYDLSCGTDQPKPDVVYGQSLLAFVENAVAYAMVRAGTDSDDAQKQRLDEAERAAKLGLEIVDTAATEDQERAGKPYLERIAPSFAVQVQENLKTQLRNIERARKDLSE
jgi:hypothetical protein